MPGSKVIVLTMGPPQAETMLRECLARGANEAVLISDRAFAGADTLATSYTLSQAVRKISEYGVIICGKQATDGDTAQVGPGIAEKLDIPHVAYVKKIEELDDKKMKVERMMEDGYDIIETPLPALITVVKEINEPRLPSLRGTLAAKRAQIVKWTQDDLDMDPNKIGLKGSPTWVSKIFTPPQRCGGEKIEGKPEQAAQVLACRLKEMKIL